MKYSQGYFNNWWYRRNHRMNPFTIGLGIILWGIVVYQVITF